MKKTILPFMSVFLAVPLLLFTLAQAAGVPAAVSRSDIDELIPRIDELVARIGATSPVGTTEEQRRLYLTLDKEIDVSEDEIDLLEDQYELDYLSGAISWDDYRALERELDGLEKKLDRAEHELERLFRSVRSFLVS